MKKCLKCGRTSPPALTACPRCKTPFNAATTARPVSRPPVGSSSAKKTSGHPVRTRTTITASILVVLVLALAAVLFMNRNKLTQPSQSSEQGPALPREISRPSNFNELLGTWSGREINRSAGWTFSFTDGYNVYASGPEGWYRGKAAIHWELGSDKDGVRVPPGAAVFDVDVKESSAGDYTGKTSVGAFSVYSGTTLKLCSGEPGKTKRPGSFDPASGIRCFELTKTAEAPPSAPAQNIAQSAASTPGGLSTEDNEIRTARDAYKRCADAIRSGNLDQAKTYISRATRAEMEQSGHFDMAMGMITGMNIDEFQAVRQGDRITFKQSQKQGDATMSMSMTMVKEDGQWKLGS